MISKLKKSARFLPLAVAVVAGSMASATSPIVGTPAAAKRLYLTILPTLFGSPVELETTVTVSDDGDNWIAFQRPRDPNIRGGTTEMKINKTDGTFSVTYAR